MSGRHQVIAIEPLAPNPPGEGEPCNGCGLCCLAEPCPLGAVLSLRLRGPCRQLRWRTEERRYVCGVLARWPAASGWAGRLARRMVVRWIAAGVGCDAALERQDLPPPA